MNILFFIPARGSSKGIPKKNLYPLLGAPLISFAIMSIREALRYFGNYEKKIFVSTDSLEIAKVANKWGAEVPFLRPKELAQDTSDVVDSIIFSAEELKKRKIFESNLIILIQPTSP